MKISKILASLSTAAIALSLTACGNVPAGHVGVQVDKYGDDRGVQMEVKTPGRYFVGPNADMFIFPTFTQSVIWENAEKITFQDKDGSPLSAPVGISYHIERSDVVKVFQKYRRGIEEITDTYLKMMVRDAFNKEASVYPADEIFGNKKSEFLSKVENSIKVSAKSAGITVERVSLTGDIDLPPAIKAAVQAKIAAVQRGLQKENELQAAKADAEKEIAKARGEAESARIRGEALKANPQVLEQMRLEKWDGKLPQVVGANATPFVNIK